LRLFDPLKETILMLIIQLL